MHEQTKLKTEKKQGVLKQISVSGISNKTLASATN